MGVLVCFACEHVGEVHGGLVCFTVLCPGRSALQEVLRLCLEHIVMGVLSLQFLPLPVVRFL